MKIDFQLGDMKYLEDCIEALMQSDLGKHYFNNYEKSKNTILSTLEKKELHIAIHGGECVGFIWYLPSGAFHSFPYLHIIAVKKNYRGKGIGKQLLAFYEERVSIYANKVFLIVDSFNPDAKRLYEKVGYQCVGTIPNIYINGVDGDIMMIIIK